MTVREGGQDRRIFVRGGFAEVSPDGLTVLAEEAILIEDLNQDRLNQEIKNAQEDVADAKDDVTRGRAQEKLDHLSEIHAVL